MKKYFFSVYLLAAIIFLFPARLLSRELTHEFDTSEILMIAEGIFRNECGRRKENLVTWNLGEEFPSIGIGHFIWYPEGYKGPFIESFPLFVDFMVKQKIDIPNSLRFIRESPFAPWKDRVEFIHESRTQKIEDLREFLMVNMMVQGKFLIKRFYESLSVIRDSCRDEDKGKISFRIDSLSQTRKGLFALIDYVNFKGEGLSLSEKYKGQGWGLKQVLLEIEPIEFKKNPLESFMKAAERIIKRRVRNAPAERGEERWLKGWINRIMRYKD